MSTTLTFKGQVTIPKQIRDAPNLLQRFGGACGVCDASVQDLCTVEGISEDLAQTIYNALR